VTFGSLFAGIGGFDLGFERAGMQCLWQVEKDAWCREKLAKHWPDVKRYEDVRDVGKHNLRTVDVICGGFPCQDVSIAGKQTGIGEGTRSGLWSQFHRIIGELRPRYAVLENVRNLLSGDNGKWFGRVLGGLAEIGYDAEWEVLPASAFGAPHERERVFLIAYPCEKFSQFSIIFNKEDGISGNLQWRATKGIKSGSGWKRWLGEVVVVVGGEISKSDFCGMDDGVSEELDKIGALGNAVVPQVAEYIGQCLMAHNQVTM